MRYREAEYKKALEEIVESFDDIVDLVNEAKRKTSSKSSHTVLEKVLKIIESKKNDTFRLLQSVGRR